MNKNETRSLETWKTYPEFSETRRQFLERERAISDSSKVFSIDVSMPRHVSAVAGQMHHEFQYFSRWDGEAWARRHPELHVGTLMEGPFHHQFVKITFIGAGGSATKSIPLTIMFDLTPNEARELSRALLNAAAALDPLTPADE
jgi:hypothetical protein